MSTAPTTTFTVTGSTSIETDTSYYTTTVSTSSGFLPVLSTLPNSAEKKKRADNGALDIEERDHLVCRPPNARQRSSFSPLPSSFQNSHAYPQNLSTPGSSNDPQSSYPPQHNFSVTPSSSRGLPQRSVVYSGHGPVSTGFPSAVTAILSSSQPLLFEQPGLSSLQLQRPLQPLMLRSLTYR
jgi:hypothetical protein